MIRIDCLVLLVQIALFSPNGFVAAGATVVTVVVGVIAEMFADERKALQKKSARPP